MIEIAPNAYKVELQPRVAAVGGSFEGEIALSDMEPPRACTIRVRRWDARPWQRHRRFEIEPEGENASKLMYKGNGEIGGLEELVAGMADATMVTLDAAHISAIEAADGFAAALDGFLLRFRK
jgi:carbon monoxide dehydrogenase subunit G